MQMRRRILIALGSAALLFAVLAAIVLWQRAAEGLARYTSVTFLPGFAEKARDAARIELSGHDGRFAVELTPQGWVLPDRGNYPANFNQVRQTLTNIVTVLEHADAKPEHIIQMTWYFTDRDAYKSRMKEIGAVYRSIIGRHFPPMAAVQVVALMEDRAKVEIQVLAVVPD